MSNHLLLDLGICATFHLIYRRIECKNRINKILLSAPKNFFNLPQHIWTAGISFRDKSWSNRETGAMHCERSVNIVTRWITIAIVIGRVNSVIQEWRELKFKSEAADKTIKFFLVESVASKTSMWHNVFDLKLHGYHAWYWLKILSCSVFDKCT